MVTRFDRAGSVAPAIIPGLRMLHGGFPLYRKKIPISGGLLRPRPTELLCRCQLQRQVCPRSMHTPASATLLRKTPPLPPLT